MKIFFLPAILLFFSACNKGGGSHQPAKPAITTIDPTNITDTSVSTGGNVTSDGGTTVTDRGIIWDTTGRFSTAHKLNAGSGTGSFYLTIPGLTQGTTYYVRAYATNTIGTGYGKTLQFTTDTIPSNYIVTTYAGNGTAATVDGQALSASFFLPIGLTVDAHENVYVTEGSEQQSPTTASHIRRIAANGAVSTLAALGSSGEDVVVDAAGNVYDVDFNTHLLYKITPAGSVGVLAGGGQSSDPNKPQDGQGTAASFINPFSMDIDKNGNIFMTDGQYIRKITPAGYASTLPVTISGRFQGIAVDRNDNLYVVDNSKIEKLDTLGNMTFIAGEHGSADGAGAVAGFSDNVPELRLDKNGDIIASDEGNHKIRMISLTGVVTTIAGSGLSADKDGSGSTCAFIAPSSLAIDASGNIFVADALANKIKKIAHK
jgi:hypothetical protein